MNFLREKLTKTNTTWSFPRTVIWVFAAVSAWLAAVMPATGDTDDQAERYSNLYQSFLQAFQNQEYEQAALFMTDAITAYDAADFRNPQERATLVYYLAETHVRNDNAPAALQVTQDGLSQQDPALVYRYPEFYRIQGWANGQLGFFGGAAAGYGQAADLGKLYNETEPGRFSPDLIAGLEFLAASARSRASFIISEETNIAPIRASLAQFEAHSDQPAHNLRYEMARALAGQGLTAEARSLFQELAADAPASIQAASLARLAILEWDADERDFALIAARAAAANDALHPSRLLLMQAMIDIAKDDLTPDDLARALLNLEAFAAPNAPLSYEDFITQIEFLKIVLDVIAETVVDDTGDLFGTEDVESALGAIQALWQDGDAVFFSDAFGRRLLRDLRLNAAFIHEHSGNAETARAIFERIWLSPEATVQEQAFAQAGLGRLGLLHQGELKADPQTLASFSRQAADYAAFFLTQIPARAETMQSRQIARFATVMGQAVDASFDLIQDRIVLGPSELPNVTDGFNQKGTYVFPWEIEPGSGYASSAGEGLYATELDDVFRQIQLARQSSAARAIAQMTARQAAGSDRLALILRERDRLIERRLSVLEASVEPDHDLFARLAEIDQQVDQVEAELDRDFPEFRNHIAMRPLTLAEARELLGTGETLITYLQTDAGLHVFAISTEHVIWHRAPVQAQWLTDTVDTLRQSLDPRGPLRAPVRGSFDLETTAPDSTAGFDLALSHALYLRVLDPIAGHVPQDETLIIVPDGALQSLPFATLVMQPPQSDAQSVDRFQRANWLIREHTLLTAPVPSTLRAMRNVAFVPAAPGTFVGVGDPAFRYDPDWLRLSQLPETQDELRTLNELISRSAGNLHLGDQAIEDAVFGENVQTASIIAFATHGLMGGETTDLFEPALALTPARGSVSSVTGRGDGLLTTSEIAQLKLRADLVLLSACNTALGPRGEGSEGLSGLARAFFYAGARQLLVSHWAVQSDATVALTTGMFRQLPAQEVGNNAFGSTSIDTAKALRKSMLFMIDTPPTIAWSHPGVWAPFVVVGG